MAEENGDDGFRVDNLDVLAEASNNPQLTVATTQPESKSQASKVRQDQGSISGQRKGNEVSRGDEEEEEEEEGDEETEPHLKYTRLTSHLGSLLKNKDSASSCLASGDKLIIGTHNGSVYIFSFPSLEIFRTYRAHSATVTSISVVPHSLSTTQHKSVSRTQPSDLPSQRSRTAARATAAVPPKSTDLGAWESKHSSTAAAGSLQTSSNAVYIATSSIDGHICVSSLIDPNDVTLRNFARPVQAVALSPLYKSSREYLSGGLAGHLTLTTGGRIGGSENANTINAATTASNWLGHMGITNTSGRDRILHQGEGGVSAIGWSISGKFVAWVNETGIKLMRSNIALGSEDSELAWKRIGHVDRPRKSEWEEGNALWRAKLQWFDERYLESDGDEPAGKDLPYKVEKKMERLLIGWGDTVWIIHVFTEGSAARTGSAKGFRKPDIVHQFKFDDGVVSGISMYTTKLLLALVYRTKDDDDRPIVATGGTTPERGIQKRQNGIPPELRVVNISSKDTEELDIESLKFERYESLSFADYHMSNVLLTPNKHTLKKQKSSLSALGDGLWDVSKNASRFFSSSASVLSSSSGDGGSDRKSTSTSQTNNTASSVYRPNVTDLPFAFAKPGLKIFIVSPYDLLLAVKRDGVDHLNWLKTQERYEQAWNYLDRHPDLFTPRNEDTLPSSRPDTPLKVQETLAEFLEDDRSSSSSAATIGIKTRFSATIRQKREIGDKWIQQLVDAERWKLAGLIAGQILDTAELWEHWIRVFTKAEKVDDISPSIPSTKLKPPINAAAYESILQYYVENDRVQLQSLLNTWDSNLYNVLSITKAIDSKLKSYDHSVQLEAVNDGVPGRDWRILQECLAHLYVAANRPADALHCHLLTRNADAAIQLVRDNQLFVSIADSVYVFATIRISQQHAASATLPELDALSTDSIHLLASAAYENVISVPSAVRQFQQYGPAADPYLFFYFRNLWNDEITSSQQGSLHSASPTLRRARFAPAISANATRHLLADYGDLAITLFATYSPKLLNELLRAREVADGSSAGGSLPYSFEHASTVCESHGLTAELVYLLAATGQTREALQRICEGRDAKSGSENASQGNTSGSNVDWAISFCYETDDQGLWDDLLAFSIDKPAFLQGLLDQVGIGVKEQYSAEGEAPTGIEPVDLINRIPEGLQIKGLKRGLERVVRDADVQRSIAAGTAQVLRREIAVVMDALLTDRKRGISFSGSTHDELIERDHKACKDNEASSDNMGHALKDQPREDLIERGDRCDVCDELCHATYDELRTPGDHIIAYRCGHSFHLTCLLDAHTTSVNRRLVDDIQKKGANTLAEQHQGTDAGRRSNRIGSKVARIQMIGRVIGGKPCIKCQRDLKIGNDD